MTPDLLKDAAVQEIEPLMLLSTNSRLTVPWSTQHGTIIKSIYLYLYCITPSRGLCAGARQCDVSRKVIKIKCGYSGKMNNSIIVECG